MTEYPRSASWGAAAFAMAVACAGCAPDDLQDESAPPSEAPWASACMGGKCDGLDGATLVICGARDVAQGYPGCTAASATDMGVDPAIPEQQVTFQIVLQGLDLPGVTVALELEDDQGQLVRTIALPNVSDGAHAVHWNGHDDAGQDVTAPWHTAQLRARRGADSVTGDGTVIATLFNLPDEGAGYYHPLGTDHRDTDDWGRAHVLEALAEVAAAWPHPRRIAFLDLSLQNGGEFRPHWNHRHGECIDLRYVRTDGEGPLDLRWGAADYDREATQQLVDALVAHGAIEIYADHRAELEGDFVVHIAGHTNHLHAKFGLTEGDTGESRPVNHQRPGGPCLDDSDCNVRDGICVMPEGETVGTCTVECSSACSDYVGGIYTLTECALTAEGHRCVPARDFARYPDTEGCRAGLTPQRLTSLDQSGALTDVCSLQPE